MSDESVQLKPRTENLKDREFGILTVESFAGYDRGARWLCRCRCGGTKVVLGHELRRGHTVSCGCKSQQIKDDAAERQPEWYSYSAMIDRCHNENSDSYPRYGAKGVRVCDRWREGFRFFLEDVGPRPSPQHTLDRYPNGAGNYEPGNVRWATKKEQGRNRRTSRIIEFRGESRSLVEWAEVLGIAYITLKTRLNRLKWPVERAFTEPAGSYR